MKKYITLAYHRSTLCFLLVFSVADRKSLEDVKLYMGYIKNCTKSNLRMLIGNKCDLKYQREVSYEEAKKVADEWDILYVKCLENRV